MAIALRLAVDADYDRIIPCLDAWWGGRQMAPMLPRLFFTHFQPWTYVAEEQDNILGFLAAFRPQSDPELIYCHFIGVNPAARGRGVGAALYERLFADAACAGCRQVLAVTSPRNRASIAFHQRLGFAILPGSGRADGVPFTPDYDGRERIEFASGVRSRPIPDHCGRVGIERCRALWYSAAPTRVRNTQISAQSGGSSDA